MGNLLPAQEMADGWMGGVGKSLDRTLVIMDLISLPSRLIYHMGCRNYWLKRLDCSWLKY